MKGDKEELLKTLSAELEFLERRGYRKHCWRPRFIFEDSPTCVNYRNPNPVRPCLECKLIPFVPAQFQDCNLPCRHIPLNQEGDTLASLYDTTTQDELEQAVAQWLVKTIDKLRAELAEHRSANALAKNSVAAGKKS